MTARRGSVLIMALWIIAILSVMVVSFAFEARQQAGIDIKSLQYLMGHSNASVTLDVYTHTDYNVVKRAFDQAAANL